jgi:pimeloyl-ACP methyl ester carboxylesterase
MGRALRIFAVMLLVVLALAGGLFAAGYQADLAAAELEKKWATGTSTFVEVDGLRVHTRDEGPRDGEIVLLLHGTGASLHTWDGWAAALTRTYRVVRIDLPGFGLTGPDPENDYSMERQVAFLHRFAEVAGLGKLHVAGNSYGGRIAWNYALAHPERVASLILVDAAGFPHAQRSLAFRLAQIPVVDNVVRYVTPRAMVVKTLREVYADDSKITSALAERYQDLTRRTGNREALIARLRTPYGDTTARLAELKVPTLVLWGAEDGYIPAADAQGFARLIPGAEVVVLDKLGHVPMEEDPARSVAPVLAFLAAAKN